MRVFLALVLFALALGLPKAEVDILPAPKEMQPETSQKAEPVRLLLGGDVMLGRFVRTLMEREGLDYPFRKIGDTLKAADAVVVNLEGPVMRNAPETPLSSLKFAFEADVVPLLVTNNVRMAAQGNNHTLDQGGAVLAETRSILDVAGVEPVGDPQKISERSASKLTIHGVDVDIVSFNATWPSFKEDEAVALVEEKSKGPEPLFILIHWGEEYKPTANKSQRELGRRFIEAGADAIIGHHPHVVQDIELYLGKPIFYSLGNFIFDQYFMQETKEGLLIEISIDEKSLNYRLLPIISKERSQPELMGEKERDIWLNALAQGSPPELSDRIMAGSIIDNY